MKFLAGRERIFNLLTIQKVFSTAGRLSQWDVSVNRCCVGIVNFCRSVFEEEKSELRVVPKSVKELDWIAALENHIKNCKHTRKLHFDRAASWRRIAAILDWSYGIVAPVSVGRSLASVAPMFLNLKG